MKLSGVVFLGGLLLAGCAERDNPNDPANRPLQQPPVDTFRFEPDPSRVGNKVVWPERSGFRDSKYYGDIQIAFSYLTPGDTLWIRTGQYYIKGQLTMPEVSGELFPVVVRSFGGPAVIHYLGDNRQEVCLPLERGFVKLVGLTFQNCGIAIMASNVKGPIELDSIVFDRNYGALHLLNVEGRATLRHVVLENNVDQPPFTFKGVAELDTAGWLL